MEFKINIFDKDHEAFAVFMTESNTINIRKVKIIERFESENKRCVYTVSDQFNQVHFFQDVELFDSLVNIGEIIEGLLSESEESDD